MGAFYAKTKRSMSIFGGDIEKAICAEMDHQKERYVPESLDLLIQHTSFNKNELKYIYQCFKQSCPSGYVTREQFVGIFRQFFCMHQSSDPSQYADLVFNTVDEDQNGRISFSEFVQELSMFNKGTLEDRIDWLFDLYDVNKRGFIMDEDYQRVCIAMYSLVGMHFWKEKHMPIALRKHLKQQFQKLDINGDGKITRSEFVEGCIADEQICCSLEALRTYM